MKDVGASCVTQDIVVTIVGMQGGRGTDGPLILRSAAIVDDQEAFVSGLKRGLLDAKIEVWSVSRFEDLPAMLARRRPDIVISELKVNGKFVFPFLSDVAKWLPLERVAIATVYPSIATAMRLVRMGIAAYLTKPVCAATILEAIRANTDSAALPDEELDWPSLNRVVWEYLSQVHCLSGSMSEAARRLGVNPRSLRRMLAKYPPAR